jgi:hypothetical protein
VVKGAEEEEEEEEEEEDEDEGDGEVELDGAAEVVFLGVLAFGSGRLRLGMVGRHAFILD